MNDSPANSSGPKKPPFNYYGLTFVTLGTANMLCYHLLKNVPATVVTLFRVALMFLGLAVVASISKKWKKLDKEDWIPMIVGGILSFASYTYFLTLGFQNTSVINGAIILNTAPVFSMLFAVLFKQEKWSWSAFAGVIVALSGVVIASLGGKSNTTNSLLGDLYVLIASISISLGTVFAHKLGSKQDPFAQTSIMGLIGILVLLPISISDISSTQWSDLKVIHWAMLMFIGIFGGAIAFGMYFKSVELFGASDTMVFLFLSIPIGALFNYLFLGKIITAIQLIGSIVVITGAAWSIYSRAKENKIHVSHAHF